MPSWMNSAQRTLELDLKEPEQRWRIACRALRFDRKNFTVDTSRRVTRCSVLNTLAKGCSILLIRDQPGAGVEEDFGRLERNVFVGWRNGAKPWDAGPPLGFNGVNQGGVGCRNFAVPQGCPRTVGANLE